MSASVIVHGPARCGKTRNAERIRKHFGMTRVVDGWAGQSTLAPGSLALTNEPPPYPGVDARVIAYEALPESVRPEVEAACTT